MEHAVTEAMSGRPDIELFLAVLNWIPLLFLIVTLVALGVKATWFAIFESQKPSMASRLWEAWTNLWGVNGIEGQVLTFAVFFFIVYHIVLWWGIKGPSEFGAILAIAAVVIAASPPATEHDAESERVVKWVLTFCGMINFAALMGTLIGEIQLCEGQDCLGPHQLLNLGSLIVICGAALYSGMLSRRSRWNSFLQMQPPLAVVRLLLFTGAGFAYWIRRDRIVKAYLAWNMELAIDLLQTEIASLKPAYVLDSVWQARLKDAIEATRGFLASAPKHQEHFEVEEDEGGESHAI